MTDTAPQRRAGGLLAACRRLWAAWRRPRAATTDAAGAGGARDVWAAAASLYYLLTGAYTRDFVDTRSAVETVLNTAPIPIRQRNPEIPAALADVIDGALDDTHEALPYRSAIALRNALRTVAPA
jgi:serine/threonine-protein kinase